jgi:hypothetical protein
MAFIRGVFGKAGMILSLSDLNSSPNAVVKTVSGSNIELRGLSWDYAAR